MISVLEAEGLTVARGERVLAERLSFRVEAGEALALTGPNGAGKTSLLRCIAGLLRPVGGEVRFSGGAGSVDAAEARARALHWLGWQDGLKAQRTVQRELAFWRRWAGGGDTGAALDSVGLAGLAEVEVRRLSAGQRRRLALARLLTPRRPLWLLDEPLAPLDAEWRERVGELMRGHLAGGGMIVAAVHDPLPIPARALPLGAAA